MKKVSILTLSLIMTLSNIVVVNARRSKNTRRQAISPVVNTANIKQSVQTNKVSLEVITPVENLSSVVSEVKKNTVNQKTLNTINEKIANVQNACSGIKSNLDTIFGLSVVTTVSSGLGTVAAGGALAVGIVKSKTDKNIENNYKKIETMDYNEMVDELTKLKNEITEDTKKSKTLGHVRTGLLAGATVTSGVSTGTSIGAIVTASKLADMMSDCNTAINELRLTRNVAEVEEVSTTDASMQKADSILSACTGYDESNIKTLKNLAITNTVVSGVGTVSAGVGTVTSAMANTDNTRNDNSEAGKKKEKNLNLAANIAAGVTTGTSATSTTLSAIQISKAKKDSDMAEVCENSL